MPRRAPDAADEAAERLYDLPLDEFTAERDRVARELRRAGDREAADRVKALRKPTLAAWAVNRLARDHREGMTALLAAGERLREAQDALLGGRGSRERLDDAARAEREAVERLVRCAAELLHDRAAAASDATVDRVRRTLHAAAGDEELRGEMEAGRVTRDREPAGFGGGRPEAAVSAPAKRTRASGSARAKPKAVRERAAKRPARRPDRREELEAARRELRRLRTAARDAERRVRETARALERAHRAFADAQEARDAAARAAEEAAAGAQETASRLKEAERRVQELDR